MERVSSRAIFNKEIKVCQYARNIGQLKDSIFIFDSGEVEIPMIGEGGDRLVTCLECGKSRWTKRPDNHGCECKMRFYYEEYDDPLAGALFPRILNEEGRFDIVLSILVIPGVKEAIHKYTEEQKRILSND